MHAGVDFRPSEYGPEFHAFLEPLPLNDLGPGSPQQDRRADLDQLDLANAFGHTRVVDQQLAECCLAGIWLLYDFLEQSHHISQSIPTIDGSYWHGIMHRREPDYGNSKYWFRQVGDHRIFANLMQAAATIVSQSTLADSEQLGRLTASGGWDPFAFVDCCQWAATSGGQAEEVVRRIAQAEWCLLFDDCYRRGVAAA